MNFPAFLIVPIAAVIAVAVVLVSGWSTSIRNNSFPVSWAASFLLSVLLIRPWTDFTLADWPSVPAVFGFIAFWAAAGTVVGMAIGMLLMKVGSLIGSAFRRSK